MARKQFGFLAKKSWKAQHLALASLLLLTAALSLAPLFGASSAGMVGYAQRWAYQRDSVMTSPYSTGAGYANFHSSRGPFSSAPLSSLPGDVVSRASPGLGVALAALLAASAAAATVLSLASLLGKGLLGLPGGTPLLSIVPVVLGASLLAVACLFYGFTAHGLRSYSADSKGALGSKPPIFPSWGWILALLAAVGWLLVPGFAAGAAARPAGGRLFGGRGSAAAAVPVADAASDVEAGRGKKVATAAAAGAAGAAAATAAAAAGASSSSKASSSSAAASKEAPSAAAAAGAAAAAAAAAAPESSKAAEEKEAAAAEAAAAESSAAAAAAPTSAVGGALAAGAAALTSGAAAVSDTLVRLYSRGFSAREGRSSGGGGAEEADVESGAEAESKRAAAAAAAAPAAAAETKGKLARVFSKSPSAKEASAAAHDITTKAFAASSSAAEEKKEQSALAGLEKEAAELQAQVDAAVKEAAAVASKDLQAARKSAIELKRSLTLELAAKDLPSGK